MRESKKNASWVIFGLEDVAFAISSESVLSINQTTKVTLLPQFPPEVRGIINFREKIIQLIDTRKLLGRKSNAEDVKDFYAMIDQRYKDHINWIETLKKSVTGNIEFTLTTDPHKCAFGKWYDSYELKNASIMFVSTFEKFDKPHKAIHKIGITATEMLAQGKQQEAIALIESVKDKELTKMLKLFDDLKEAYRENLRETILIIGDENHCIGIAVDKIIAIENLFEIDESFIKETLTDTEYLSGIAKDKKGSIVLLLNEDYILSMYH